MRQSGLHDDNPQKNYASKGLTPNLGKFPNICTRKCYGHFAQCAPLGISITQWTRERDFIMMR